MTVRKKASKHNNLLNIDEIINRGGKTCIEAVSEPTDDTEIRITLRIPNSLLQKIDEDRRSRVGNISRNQWLTEAIVDAVNLKQ